MPGNLLAGLGDRHLVTNLAVILIPPSPTRRPIALRLAVGVELAPEEGEDILRTQAEERVAQQPWGEVPQRGADREQHVGGVLGMVRG